MLRSFTSVQLDPFQNSVLAFVPGAPPKANAPLVVPEAASADLGLFTFPTSVQLDPFQVSTFAVSGGSEPLIAIADVLDDPHPPSSSLAVLKSDTSVHADPFHDSVSAFPPVPPKNNPDVCIPAGAPPLLPVGGRPRLGRARLPTRQALFGGQDSSH